MIVCPELTSKLGDGEITEGALPHTTLIAFSSESAEYAEFLIWQCSWIIQIALIYIFVHLLFDLPVYISIVVTTQAHCQCAIHLYQAFTDWFISADFLL